MIETLGKPTRLRRAQRNRLFQLINEMGSDARQFSWEEPPDEILSFPGKGWGGVCFLRHTPTDALFRILANVQDLNGTLLDYERYTFSYAPPPVFSVIPQRFNVQFPDVFAKNQIPREETKNYLVEWRDIENHFRLWLRMVIAAYDVVRDEEQAPDLWRDFIGAGTVAVSILTAGGNSGFSPAEISHVAKMIEDLQSEVQQLGVLSWAQFETLSAALSQQSEAASRLGRKDWANAFLGALMGAALSSNFSSEAAKIVFPLVIEKLNLLWHELQRLLS